VVIATQIHPFAYTDEAKEWAQSHGCKATRRGDYVDWLSKNYPWPVRTDPVPSWRKRVESLRSEKDRHVALKKYTDFMRQTEEIRGQIDELAALVDADIQMKIDMARGK